MALSWDEIVNRGKKHNKTLICEVEKRGAIRYFKFKCNVCESEVVKSSSRISKQCDICNQLKWQDKNKLKEEFVLKAKKIHLEKYNYDVTEYFNCKTKIRIYCNRCNEIFSQTPMDHLHGYGCRKCGWDFGHDKIRGTTEEFIIKAKKIHDNKFNYELVRYKNSLSKVQIKCNQCETIFLQSPKEHLRGYGCKKCADNTLRSNTIEFIFKAKEIHGDKFNYDLVEYVKSCNKIDIKCNKCNKIFSIIASSHLKINSRCPVCLPQIRYDNTKFIFKAKEIHGNKFNYDLVEYVNSRDKIIIKCNKCENVFLQAPHHHIGGKGCPYCNESKGENRVAKYLSYNNIKYTKNKIFKTLKDKSYLKPDFYLSELNLLIEYDGIGHFEAIFGSTPEDKQKNLEDCQRRDKIKDEWAKANNIPLLRIPYWDFDRIEELIEAFILQHTKKKEINQLALEI